MEALGSGSVSSKKKMEQEKKKEIPYKPCPHRLTDHSVDIPSLSTDYESMLIKDSA